MLNRITYKFNNNELPVVMMDDLVELFTPNDWNILDPYNGSISVANLAVKNGQKCVFVEHNSDRFLAALKMLSKLLQAVSEKRTIEQTFRSDIDSQSQIHTNLYDLVCKNVPTTEDEANYPSPDDCETTI